MGKNKLKKFADMDTFRCALQYPREVLLNEGFPYRGTWNGGFFPLSGPVTLELGCGKGEYTVALAKANPGRNYIGVDIKGRAFGAAPRRWRSRESPTRRFFARR